MTINETTLEMHFHRPLMDLFRKTFGVGPAGRVNFYKYSPQKECFVGFDQAYVMSQLSERAFFDLLKTNATSNQYQIAENDRFIGYFLQFKVGRRMKNRGKNVPTQVTNLPHYRFTIDTTKNDRTGFAQHELLQNLCKNSGAFVYYACPMLFDRIELYEEDNNDILDKLRLVDLATCPGNYSDNSKHSIFFNDTNASPIWCSEPHEGTAITATEFAEFLIHKLQSLQPAVSRQQLLEMLTTGTTAVVDAQGESYHGKSQLRVILRTPHAALTIIQLAPD